METRLTRKTREKLPPRKFYESPSPKNYFGVRKQVQNLTAISDVSFKLYCKTMWYHTTYMVNQARVLVNTKQIPKTVLCLNLKNYQCRIWFIVYVQPLYQKMFEMRINVTKLLIMIIILHWSFAILRNKIYILLNYYQYWLSFSLSTLHSTEKMN